MLVNQNKDTYDRKTHEYIVAYIDLLGVTNKIQSKDSQLAMNKLHNLYTFSVKLTRDVQIEENQDIQFKIFSDNIIIAKKLSNQIPQRTQEIRSLLMCAGHFQELSASDSVGWLLRGGISIGQLFIDDVMVWGEALLKSYYLEDKIANYPRIIIDSEVVSIHKEFLNKVYNQEHRTIGKIIKASSVDVAIDPNNVKKDFDGIFFINYLSTTFTFRGDPYIRFNNHKIAVVENLIHYCNNIKISQKYLWCQNYHNNSLGKMAQIFPKFIITQDDLPNQCIIDD